jgi:hypothetical protein
VRTVSHWFVTIPFSSKLTAIIIFFIAVFLLLDIGIGLGNIFTLATFPSPPTQSGGGQVDSCKWFHGLLL